MHLSDSVAQLLQFVGFAGINQPEDFPRVRTINAHPFNIDDATGFTSH